MSVRQRVSDKQHRWLSLVETTGIVLSEPVLAEAAPAGFRPLDKRKLAEFYKARDIWNLPQGMVEGDPDSRWTDFILEEMLALRAPAYWQVGAEISPRHVATLSQQRETLRPTRVLIDGENAALLFLRVPRTQSLDTTWTTNGGWKASATTKLERLLRDTGVEVGLLTNGESWRLVVASPSETASWLTWTAQTWADSPSTLAAFVELLGEARFFAGARLGTILELVRASRHRQADVADQLGFQVREALELFVRELDRIDAEQRGALLDGYSLDDIFESGVVFIMRLLFLLKAEETGLLPHGSVAYDRGYGALSLLTRLEEMHRLAPEKLDRSREAYPQLLATSRVVHEGSPDPDIHVAEYGGALFDPNRFPLLEGRKKDGNWSAPERPEPLPVRDSVVRDILRSLKYARTNVGVQLVSYRTLEVEHIGHMYEGLLDRSLAKAPLQDPVLLLFGSNRDTVPEIRSSDLAQLQGEALVKRLAGVTGRSTERVQDLLAPPPEDAWLPDLGTTDASLVEIALPIRRLLRNRGVIRGGGIYVATGINRRSQGAHYTPAELTEPIVRHALEPLVFDGPTRGAPREKWALKGPEDLLSLRVCDVAMGSGAFLVQVVRYLSARLVESWDAQNVKVKGPLSLPFGLPSTGNPAELLIPDDHSERLNLAARYVVERCVYGVDRNPLAVEMAKLSLWLATLSKDRPFTFLDHALRWGDSLLGVTDLGQITHFHLIPEKGRVVHQTLFDYSAVCAPALSQAIDLRRKVESFPVNSVRDAKRKEVILKEADAALSVVKLIGDMVVGITLQNRGKSERSLDSQFRTQAKLLQQALPIAAQRPGAKTIQHLREDATTMLGSNPDTGAPRRPFHWVAEFPEVFLDAQTGHPGFDAIVGNPPFMVAFKLAPTLGVDYGNYLKSLWRHARGRADLSAYFLLTTARLLRKEGCLGLITTKTIAQEDNRRVALDHLCAGGHTIFRAVPRLEWPGKAAVHVAVLHLHAGPWSGPIILDGKAVPQIGTNLSVASTSAAPHPLSNLPCEPSKGTTVNGTGFVLSELEAKALLASDARNAAVVRPFLNGAELNSSSSLRGDRFIIDFRDWDRTKSESYPAVWAIVQARVAPQREAPRLQVHQRDFWKFSDRRPELYRALAECKRAIAMSLVSKHYAFAFVPADQVFSSSLIVIPTDDAGIFGILQSSIHLVWAEKYQYSLKGDPRYSIGSCYRTFPFFNLSGRESNAVRELGQTYHEKRAQLMSALNIGLRRFYDMFHAPAPSSEDFLAFRQLHTNLDRAVISAYGWSDLVPEYCETMTERGSRFSLTQDVRAELLARLLALNHQRSPANSSAPTQPLLDGLEPHEAVR